MKIMDAAGIGPVFRRSHQAGAHGILANVSPLLRIALAVSQPMVKSTRLKCPGVRMYFGETIFPKAHPAFDSESQIPWGAEQMQVVGHQEIIADEPRGRSLLPNLMERSLNRRLSEPSAAFVGADGEKNPIRAGKGRMNAFGGSVAARFPEWNFTHDECLMDGEEMKKNLIWAKRQLCPTRGLYRILAQ
ncbi:MAG TPA: hypothetical protein VFV81_05065 [Verrucomicrobiae bacterium]|nr:hypothetical protein [Verrucomicrobiae bacterium]